jgi:hypothetical protein
MAEDKKPKIDLKSRLQKMGGAAPVVPPAAGSGPSGVPVPTPGRSAPGLTPIPPPSIPPGVPAPFQSAPAVIDPSNPLAAAAAGFHPSAAASVAAAPPQPQRIEVDEQAVQDARRGARRQGFVVAFFALLVGTGLGFMGGGAQEKSSARTTSIQDAKDLAGKVQKAKDTLQQISDKVDAGRNSLLKDRKYPATLTQDLAALNVDFAGDKLFGRRFSGVSTDTMKLLFDFITRVSALNDKKMLVQSLLSRLQKPITEELSRPAGTLPIQYVVVVDQNTPGSGAFLAQLAAPIVPDEKFAPPADLTFVNPRASGGNIKLPRLTSDKIPKDGAAITVVPNTVEKIFPSEQRGQIVQLGTAMAKVVDELKGIPASSEMTDDSKPGLVDIAQKLVDGLSKAN